MTDSLKFEDWIKTDLRVAEIMEVENIPSADKLFKLKLDLGTETRTIVAGLKSHYTSEELEGKRVIIVYNLEPKKLKGIISHGMLLAAVNEDHSKVKLLTPDGDVELGSKVC